MSKKPIILGVLMTILVIAGGRWGMAQVNVSTEADEQVLRELIQRENEGKEIIEFTEEAIYVTGAFPRPIIGGEAARLKEEQMAKRRPNEARKTDVQRLVVSQSGDIAYEFGDVKISYDGPDEKRLGFTGSYLRVWRKMSGDWKVDVLFARPDQP